MSWYFCNRFPKKNKVAISAHWTVAYVEYQDIILNSFLNWSERFFVKNNQIDIIPRILSSLPISIDNIEEMLYLRYFILHILQTSVIEGIGIGISFLIKQQFD